MSNKTPLYYFENRGCKTIVHQVQGKKFSSRSTAPKGASNAALSEYPVPSQTSPLRIWDHLYPDYLSLFPGVTFLLQKPGADSVFKVLWIMSLKEGKGKVLGLISSQAEAEVVLERALVLDIIRNIATD